MTPKANTPHRRREPAGNETAPVPEVGRRPSNPAFLLLLGIMWVLCGVIAFARLDASWRLIPAVVFVGIGGLFLRGAATTIVRRND